MVKTSTENYPDDLFRAHGKISLSVAKDQVLVYRATGPFNKELLDAVKVVEQDILEELQQRDSPWCELVIFEQSCMALPEVITELGLYLKQLESKAMSPAAAAFVITPDVEGLVVMREKYEQCYQHVQTKFSIFDNEDDALRWLKETIKSY